MWWKIHICRRAFFCLSYFLHISLFFRCFMTFLINCVPVLDRLVRKLNEESLGVFLKRKKMTIQGHRKNTLIKYSKTRASEGFPIKKVWCTTKSTEKIPNSARSIIFKKWILSTIVFASSAIVERLIDRCLFIHIDKVQFVHL